MESYYLLNFKLMSVNFLSDDDKYIEHTQSGTHTALINHPVTTGHFFWFLQSSDPRAQCNWHLDILGIIIYQFSVANSNFVVCDFLHISSSHNFTFTNKWIKYEENGWKFHDTNITRWQLVLRVILQAPISTGFLRKSCPVLPTIEVS